MKKNFLLPLLSALLLTSCDPCLYDNMRRVLTTNPDTLPFSGNGGNQDINLLCPMAWVLKKPADFPAWITVTPESGNG